jgi:lipopolysaccharide export LptBFGC system permease protein LptF
MAESDGADFQRKGALTFYTLLLAGGIALYWIWAVLYDTWYPFTKGNIAIYVVYMPMIAFGVIGILLYKRKKPLAQ